MIAAFTTDSHLGLSVTLTMGLLVSRATRPAPRSGLTSVDVQHMSARQDLAIVAGMTLCWAHKADSAVPMLMVLYQATKSLDQRKRHAELSITHKSDID